MAVGSRLMAEIESAEVTVVLSQVFLSKAPLKLNQLHQVLADLVQGEFQQLETKEDEGQVFGYSHMSFRALPSRNGLSIT